MCIEILPRYSSPYIDHYGRANGEIRYFHLFRTLVPYIAGRIAECPQADILPAGCQRDDCV
jgi:hypothetical protein